MSNRRRGRFPNRTLSSRVPSWLLSAGGTYADIDIDFANDRAWASSASSSIASLVLTTRASSAYYTNSSGVLSSFSSNTLRYGDLGALIEESRTNVVLWCRDLTNAAWTKTNCSASLNQTGADGSSNSASSLTASAGNATCLQSITLGSSARFQTAYVKRLTGTGTINMTMDNGTTWTDITSSVQSGVWTRASIPSQTLANPTVGFRIVTNGDAIAVDFVGNENGVFATSPIATTTTSATRAADVVTSTLPAALQSLSSYSLWASGTPQAPTSFATTQAIAALSDGTNTNRFQLYRQGGTGSPGIIMTAASAIQFNAPISGASAWAQNSAKRIAIGANSSGQQAAYDGAADLNSYAATMLSGTTQLSIGAAGAAAGSTWNGYITRVAVWNSRITAANLAAIP